MQDQKSTQNNSEIASNSIVMADTLSKQEPQKQKKKSKLIFRKTKNTVPLLLNYSYIFKISESLILNERALKQPTSCQQSFMASVFYFKSIQSLTLNQHYVSLRLKEVQQNQFPICYYTERFKSFGDKDFYQLAQTLELLDLEYKKNWIQPVIYQQQEEERRKLRKQLEEIMEQKKGKKILCFYNQPTGDHVSMNRIVISTQLLNALGYNIPDLSRDFLKYRHIFFEIFDTSFYCQLIKKAHQKFLSSIEKKTEDKNLQVKQKPNSRFNEETFSDYIFRVRQDDRGIFEQKVPASIIFSKPYPHLSLYQISEIDESNIIITLPKKHHKNNDAIKQYEQKILLDQRKTLESLQYDNLLV